MVWSRAHVTVSQTLPSLTALGWCTIALVSRVLDTGWMLLALSKLPRDPLFPSLSTYAASFRPSPKEAVTATREQGKASQDYVLRVQCRPSGSESKDVRSW